MDKNNKAIGTNNDDETIPLSRDNNVFIVGILGYAKNIKQNDIVEYKYIVFLLISIFCLYICFSLSITFVKSNKTNSKI